MNLLRTNQPLGKDRRRQSVRMILLSCALALGASGCSDVAQIESTAPRISSEYLTASVQSSVLPDGTFILRHSVLSADIPEIDETQARSIASAFVQEFARFLLPVLEKDRGGAISLSQLRLCGRVFYAAGAYEALSLTAPAVIRKATGPQWIVPFCAGGTPEVAVHVSAYATDAILSKDLNSLTSVGQANFSVQGVPVGKEIPASPEDIAKAVFSLTGRHVAAVPELVMRPVPEGAALAVWSVSLDGPARVRSATRSWATDTVFVGYFSDWENQLLAPDSSTSPAGPQEIAFNPPPGSKPFKTKN